MGCRVYLHWGIFLGLCCRVLVCKGLRHTLIKFLLKLLAKNRSTNAKRSLNNVNSAQLLKESLMLLEFCYGNDCQMLIIPEWHTLYKNQWHCRILRLRNNWQQVNHFLFPSLPNNVYIVTCISRTKLNCK